MNMKNGEGEWGYNEPKEYVPLNYDFETLKNAYAHSNAIEVKSVIKTNVEPFHTIQQFTGTYNGRFVTNLKNNISTEYRYTIIPVDRNGEKNIYVADHIVYEEDLKQIITKLNGANKCYVTQELISETYDSTKNKKEYEISETAYDFMRQTYKKDEFKGWSRYTRGVASGDNALSAVFNLYDNELIFPSTSTQTLYVRHIDIGTGDVIDVETVTNGKLINTASSSEYIFVDDTKTSANGSNSEYSEYYTGIPIFSNITKIPLQENELKALNLEGKKYIGYTYGVGYTKADAEDNRDAWLESGVYYTVPEFELEKDEWDAPDKFIAVDFYYSSEEKQPEVPVTEKEPEKDIDGKVFVKSADDVEGTCIDIGDSWQIVSIPSGTNATVGIDNIPQYMAGAITLQQQQVKDTATYNVTVSKGTESTTTTYKVYYDITYYNVTNMLVYKYNGIKINDASSNKIFSWASGVLTDNKLIKTPKVELTGINNKTISNNSTVINTATNYYKIEFVSNKGTVDVTNSKSGSLNITLTEQEYNEIDIDNNGEISSSELANWLDLEAIVQVQNMNVKIDNNNLYDSNQIVQEEVDFVGAKTKNIDVSTTKPVVSKTKYDNLTGEKITKNSYTNESYVKQSVLNGVRALSGTANYITTNVIGNSTTAIDTVYYSEKNAAFRLNVGKTFSKEYEVKIDATTAEAKYEEVEPVNIYTPITVKSTIEIDKNDVIDQTGEENVAPLLQMNTTFKVKVTNQKVEGVYGIDNTTKYSSGYYIKFDFDVHKVKVDGKTYNNGSKISAGTWIGFLSANNKGYVEVTAQAYSEDENEKFVSEEKSSYTVRAVAYNATELMKTTSKLYPTLKDLVNSGDSELVDNICSTPSYFAEETNQIMIINRMYDFRVTDVKDIEWKETFRTTAGSVVNKHTGIVYNSGTTKWDVSAKNNTNQIVNRPTSEIGRNPVRILPIGPYKNTDITKLKAPKLGYRLSFDLKVTGSYYTSTGDARTDKEVNIQTKFYYISKDGKTFIEESTGGEGVYLFYKNSSGKYVKIDANGGGYNLKFTPQDGYRYIDSSDTKNLATTLVSLGNLRKMTLKYNMATPTDNKGAIIYYGEYKLPNSTIAVKVDNNGKYDINKPLTDGYIGVVFNISATAGTITQGGVEKPVVLKYSQNTTAETNTSQWDYEGFLGFANYGNNVKAGELSIKLEKGVWQVTDSIYNKIKGTVILYDIDERAATDFE